MKNQIPQGITLPFYFLSDASSNSFIYEIWGKVEDGKLTTITYKIDASNPKDVGKYEIAEKSGEEAGFEYLIKEIEISADEFEAKLAKAKK